MAETTWTSAQLKAIDAQGSNLLVSAAAGSGKTTVLVERVIREITREKDPLDISRLLVMTFTRAAAAQMKQKIMKAIREQIHAHPENAFLRSQLMKVQTARICTIDSLCAEIVRDHFQDIDLDPGYRIADDAEINLLRKDTLQKLLEEKYAEGSQEFLDFVQYYTDKNDSKLEDILLTLYRYAQSHPEPEAWLRGAASPYLKAGNLFAGEDQQETAGAGLSPSSEGSAADRSNSSCDSSSAEIDEWMKAFATIVNQELVNILQMAEAGLHLSNCNYGPAPYARSFQQLMEDVADCEGRPFDYRKEALDRILDGWQKLPPVSTKNGEVDEDLKEAASDLRKDIKKRLEDLRDRYFYADLETLYREMAACTPIARTITELTLDFSRRLSDEKKEKKLADFSDIAHYALQVLMEYEEDGSLKKDPSGQPIYTRTADLMAQSIDEIIVDEYQDTNLLQDDLVMALSRERFGQPNVFLVGDVKQSIYGFRLACPELFLKKLNAWQRGAETDAQNVTAGEWMQHTAAECLAAGEHVRKTETPANGKSTMDAGRVIILDRNFRSRREVLDLTNLVFEQAMVEEIGGISYRNGHALVYGDGYDQKAVSDPAEYGRPGNCPQPGNCHRQESPWQPEISLFSGSAEQAKYLEAYQIAKRIEALLSEGHFGLNDMVILTRSTDNPQLEEVLYQRGIPVIKNSGKGFWDSLEIRLVLDLLQIIDNPFQDIPFAAVLYSPLCGATAEELARIRLAGSAEDSLFDCLRRYQESDRFHWFLEKLELWRQKAADMGIYDFISYVMQESGLDTILMAMPQGEVRKGNLDFLKSRAAAFAKGSYTGLFHFIRYIRELKDSDIDFGTASPSGGAQAVRMMTIHRSKGLEFPVVFLACCGKKYNETDLNSSIIPDQRLGLGLEWRDPATRMVRKTILMQTIRQQQKLETYAEEMRLLYVAMTRAKEKLIITGTDGHLPSKIKKWNRNCLLGSQTPEVYQILGASSYLELLGLTLYASPEKGKKYVLNCQDEPEMESDRAEELLEGSDRQERLRNLAEQEMDISGIRKQCAYRYPYEKATRIQGKITASQMERKDIEPREGARLSQSSVSGESPSRELENQEGETGILLTGASRGNSYHHFLELMDYGRDLSEQIAELKAQGKLSDDDERTIDLEKIRQFLDSSIGQRMAQAARNGRLYREQQFVMGTMEDIHALNTLTGPEVQSDIPDEELLLVQGVIDAFFIEETSPGKQQIVIVDYKTDKVRNEEHYLYKYAPQLDIYANALERGFGLKVSEKIIYSLELGREICL